MPSQFLGGLRDGFERRPCRAQGERYPGCPLDQIEPSQRGYDDAGEAMHVAQLEGTIAEAREVIAGLLAEKQELEQRAADFGAWQRAVAERDAVIETLSVDLVHTQATRDRYQTNGKRVAAEKRELEALARDLTEILQYPNMRKAMLAAQHPDRGKTDAEKRARTARFQKVGNVLDRIETKGRAR